MESDMLSLNVLTEKIVISPITLANKIQGAVNNGAGYSAGAVKMAIDGISLANSGLIDIGDYFTIGRVGGAIDKLAGYTDTAKSFEVDAFTAEESANVEVGDYVSFKTETTLHRITDITLSAGAIIGIDTATACGIALADDDVLYIYKNKPYRLEYIDRDETGVIEGVGFYPGLEENVADGDILIIGGDAIRIDLGTIGEDGGKFKHSFEKTEQKDQTKNIVDRRISPMINYSAPIITVDRENYLLLTPGASYIADATTAGKIKEGIKAGIFKGLKAKVIIKAVDDEDNVNKWKVIPTGLVDLEDTEWGGIDAYISLPITINASKDSNGYLWYSGSDDAAW